MDQSFISIIIPCRNEEKFIGKCLDSIIFQDYPKESLEILVVDGASEDRTKEIVKSYSEKYGFVKLLDNPQKYTPFALNIGIGAAKGDIIVRMDAHSGCEKDYLSKCVRYLKDYNADNVGGVIKTLPVENTISAKSIAYCLSHPFGAGSSRFRTGIKEPTFVDTVFGGCYKREVFEKIGMFNENLKRSQDLEFNLRLKKAGGKTLLVPDIISYYYPSVDFESFFRHNFLDGIWSVYPMKFVKMPFRLRHYLPFLFVSSLLVSGISGIFFPVFSLLFLSIAGLYFFTAVYFSFLAAFKENDPKLFLALLIAFVIRHFGYGFGSVWGLIKLLRG